LKSSILIQHILKRGIDLILPPRCPVNGTIVDSVGAISPQAWKELTFISSPHCPCCGIPFAVENDAVFPLMADYLCGQCLSTPRHFEKSKSLLVYDDGSRKMILSFKHADAPHLHTTLAPLLVNLGKDFLNPDSVLVPIPLHWRRLVSRRYNQSAILANAMSKISGVICWPDVLMRVRHTPPQGHKSAKDRYQNVAGAFEINSIYQDKLNDKKIVLIDDVFTTGATLDECAKVLKSAGVKSVNLLTLARVTKE
jgi:ComF family protein